MAKIIVTHYSPDFDGIPAIWLLRKFHPDFKNAKLAFVPAGEAYNGQPPDSDPDILNVDTGMGKFDHHQNSDFTCGAQLVYEWLIDEGYIAKDDEALARLIQIVTELDHGWDNYQWCEPASDRWEFSLHNILSGFKILYGKQEEKYIDLTIEGLEAVYQLLKNKVKAEKEIKDGLKFKSRWGQGVAVYTRNDSIMDLAIKMGFALVVRKDPERGNVRVTGSSFKKVDLTKAYEVFVKKDPQATWFLHSSKVLLRNGSSRNPKMKASRLTIEEVVEILKRV